MLVSSNVFPAPRILRVAQDDNAGSSAPSIVILSGHTWDLPFDRMTTILDSILCV